MSRFQHKRTRAVSYRPYGGGTGAPPRLNRRTGGFIGVEHKWFDSGIALTSVGTGLATARIDPSTPSDLDHLAGVSQGTSENQRIGRKIKLTSLHIRGYLKLASQIDATPTANEIDQSVTVRITVLLDTQSNGAQYAIADAYQGHESSIVTQGDGAGPAMRAGLFFRNLEHSARFKILKDFKVEMNPSGYAGYTATVASTALQIPFEFEIPLNVVMEFQNTTGLMASVTTNSLHITALQENCAGSENVTIAYLCRVRYVG